MRALFALLAWLCVAGAAVAQMPPGAYGPGPCPFGASSCQVTATGGTTATMANWTASLAAQFPIAAYGAVSNGSTDDTTAVNNAIAAASTAGGGTVVFPCNKTTLMNGAMVIPFTGTSSPTQKPLRLTGCLAQSNGYWQSLASGGTRIDMRYAGAAGVNAKIDTRGAGVLEIDHLILMDGGTDNFPFVWTTNTALFIHDAAFSGNPTCSGVTCAQNAIQLGGITSASSTLGTNVATNGFQGYGTAIANNFFDHIKVAVGFGGSANGVYLSNNTISKTSGSGDVLGAPYVFYGVGLGTAGNTIYGGIIEMSNYPYGVTMTSNGATNSFNLIDGIGYWDEVMAAPTIAAIYVDASSPYNTLSMTGYFDGVLSAAGIAGAGAGSNTVWAGGFGGTPSVIRSPVHATATGNSYFASAKFGIANTNPQWPLDVGAGSGNVSINVNGGASGTGAGPAVVFSYNGSLLGGVGGYSSVMGGTFNQTTVLYGFLGLRFNSHNTDAAVVDLNQHWTFGNTTAPTIASGACGTGTNGTITSVFSGTSSNDMSGGITIGAAATTACAVVFANAWTVAPRICHFTALGTTDITVAKPALTALATTGFTLSGAALASTQWAYDCH